MQITNMSVQKHQNNNKINQPDSKYDKTLLRVPSIPVSLYSSDCATKKAGPNDWRYVKGLLNQYTSTSLRRTLYPNFSICKTMRDFTFVTLWKQSVPKWQSLKLILLGASGSLKTGKP